MHPSWAERVSLKQIPGHFLPGVRAVNRGPAPPTVRSKRDIMRTSALLIAVAVAVLALCQQAAAFVPAKTLRTSPVLRSAPKTQVRQQIRAAAPERAPARPGAPPRAPRRRPRPSGAPGLPNAGSAPPGPPSSRSTR